MGVIVGLSIYCSYIIKGEGKRRIQLYDSLIDFIGYIKNGINFYCTPTMELLREYNNEILEKSGFLNSIKTDSWNRFLKESELFDGKTERILTMFLSKLGRSSSEEQIKNCDWAIESLEQINEGIKAEVIGKYKVYSALSVISGLMIVVLLI